MELKRTFNEDPSGYDKHRPEYVKGLFEDLLNYRMLDAGSRAIEVGIGTGQATRPFLETGCQVTAIELGADLAAFSRDKFAAYDNLEIINMDFESVELPGNAYDMVYSASAFHWIPLHEPELRKMMVTDKLERRSSDFKRHGFERVENHTYYTERRLTAREYVELISTYSNHSIIPDDDRIPFLAGVEEAINKHGGYFTLGDTILLTVGIKK